MPPRPVPAAVRREIDGVREWLAEQQEAARQRDDQARAQTATLEQLLTRLNEMANPPPPAQPVPAAQNPPPPAQPAPQAANPVAPEVPPAVNQVGEPVYERFRRQKPPRFDGTHDPATAEEWFKRLQHIFGYMGLADAEKVACAVTQLDKEAMCWWEVVGQTEDLHAVTWERFTRVFREKYLGEARLAGKVREFLSIRQGRMSVAEYVGKFDELARFAPAIVPTDDARKMKFVHRLRPEVAKQIDRGRE